MARLKLGLHPPRMPARPLGELLILHLTLLDPAARPDAPPLPSVPERVPADSVGCDGAQHAGSAAPMVHRAHSWPHWLPPLPLHPKETGGGVVGCAGNRYRRPTALSSLRLSGHCY